MLIGGNVVATNQGQACIINALSKIRSTSNSARGGKLNMCSLYRISRLWSELQLLGGCTHMTCREESGGWCCGFLLALSRSGGVCSGL